MFIEDVHLAVMPIGGRAEKHKDFAVTLEGSRDECEKTQRLLGKIGRDDGHDLAEMVCKAGQYARPGASGCQVRYPAHNCTFP